MKTFWRIVLGVLAVFGVLFIILMFIPDDEGEAEQTEQITAEEEAEQGQGFSGDISSPLAQTSKQEAEAAPKQEQEEDAEEAGKQEESAEVAESAEETAGNTETVTIPAGELSEQTLHFKTVSLDNQVITQDIFAEHDITLVHVWATFCGPCIAEMGEYAKLYSELPDNVGMVGLVLDVYDGINSNVSDANEILSDAGARFPNMRVSDDLYDVSNSFQFVPSSFFVDSEGHIIGKLMDGAGFEETKQRLDGYLK